MLSKLKQKVNILFLVIVLVYAGVSFATIPNVLLAIINIISCSTIVLLFISDSFDVVDEEINSVDTALNFIKNTRSFISSEKVDNRIYRSAFYGGSGDEVNEEFFDGDTEFKDYMLAIYTEDSKLSDPEKLNEVRKKYKYSFLTDFLLLMSIYNTSGVISKELEHKFQSVIHDGGIYVQNIKKDYYSRRSGWSEVVGFQLFILIVFVVLRYAFGDLYTMWVTHGLNAISVVLLMHFSLFIIILASKKLKGNTLYEAREL